MGGSLSSPTSLNSSMNTKSTTSPFSSQSSTIGGASSSSPSNGGGYVDSRRRQTLFRADSKRIRPLSGISLRNARKTFAEISNTSNEQHRKMFSNGWNFTKFMSGVFPNFSQSNNNHSLQNNRCSSVLLNVKKECGHQRKTIANSRDIMLCSKYDDNTVVWNSHQIGRGLANNVISYRYSASPDLVWQRNSANQNYDVRRSLKLRSDQDGSFWGRSIDLDHAKLYSTNRNSRDIIDQVF